MFETSGDIDEKIISSLKKYFMPKAQNVAIIIMCVVFLVLGSVFLFREEYVIAVILLIGFGILVLENMLLCNKYYKTCINRMEETSGSKTVQCKLIFDDEGCTYTNCNTGGSVHFKYSVFVNIIETKEVFAVFTKANQFFVVFKESFDEKTEEHFRVVLLEKCSKVKKINKA